MSIDTSDRPEAHVNRSVKRRSGAVSLRRVNSISNGPEVVEHGDASATSTPLHVLCEFRGSEMRTSRNDNTGLQRFPATACIPPKAERVVTGKTNGCERRFSVSFRPPAPAAKSVAKLRLS